MPDPNDFCLSFKGAASGRTTFIYRSLLWWPVSEWPLVTGLEEALAQVPGIVRGFGGDGEM